MSIFNLFVWRICKTWSLDIPSHLLKPEVESGVGRWVLYLNRERKLDSLVGRRPFAPPAPKGLYIYGNVGSGKTMLMDMFYGVTKGIVKHRRRFHFHEVNLLLCFHDGVTILVSLSCLTAGWKPLCACPCIHMIKRIWEGCCICHAEYKRAYA
ncbi:uncharacterized protein [Euphorbia lathyris]|uniref:uncharacterized protein isoform X3 n=1 Tax=Euphorbia lathyris TaxID=212925 RepID=UPI0033141C6D